LKLDILSLRLAYG